MGRALAARSRTVRNGPNLVTAHASDSTPTTKVRLCYRMISRSDAASHSCLGKRETAFARALRGEMAYKLKLQRVSGCSCRLGGC